MTRQCWMGRQIQLIFLMIRRPYIAVIYRWCVLSNLSNDFKILYVTVQVPIYLILSLNFTGQMVQRQGYKALFGSLGSESLQQDQHF